MNSEDLLLGCELQRIPLQLHQLPKKEEKKTAERQVYR